VTNVGRYSVTPSSKVWLSCWFSQISAWWICKESYIEISGYPTNGLVFSTRQQMGRDAPRHG